jgi:hypothetical protein
MDKSLTESGVLGEKVVCNLAEVHQEISNLVKQKNEISRKIHGLQLSCALIYCECEVCKNQFFTTGGYIREFLQDQAVSISVGVQVDRSSLEDQDLWTDTSGWMSPTGDEDFVNPESISRSNNLGESGPLSNNSTPGFWDMAWRMASQRVSKAIVLRSPNQPSEIRFNRSQSSCSSGGSSRSLFSANLSFNESVAKKLDTLCTKLCGDTNQNNAGADVLCIPNLNFDEISVASFNSSDATLVADSLKERHDSCDELSESYGSPPSQNENCASATEEIERLKKEIKSQRCNIESSPVRARRETDRSVDQSRFERTANTPRQFIPECDALSAAPSRRNSSRNLDCKRSAVFIPECDSQVSRSS